jgi:hypothetical protein
VLLYRLADLKPLVFVLVDTTDRLIQTDNLIVAGKVDVFVIWLAIDVTDDVAVVDAASSGNLQKIVTASDRLLGTFDRAVLLLNVELNLGGDGTLLVIGPEELHVCLVVAILHIDPEDLNLLDQFSLVRVYGIQTVHHVVSVNVGRRVPQRAKRVQRLNRVLTLGRGGDALWFVDNDDRIGGLNELDWLVTRHSVVGPMDDICLVFFVRVIEALPE